MTSLFSDFRFAVRTIRRSPLFATVAIVSLALGIGANTAIFTIMDQLMLRQLPVRDPEQLVMLHQKGAHNGSNMGSRMHSYPIYQDFQKKGAPFSEVLCRRIMPASVSLGNQTERVQVELVSGNYFSMLGVKTAAGRLFSSAEDDQVFGGHPVVVLSYDYWVSRLDRDKNAIGRKILVNNYPMTIVGVSGPGFHGLDPASAPQIRVPVLMEKVMAPEWAWMDPGDRRTRWVQVFARLKPGYTAASAAAPMQVLFHQIREYEATLPKATDWTPYARQQFMRGTIHVEKAEAGYSQLRNSFSTALVVLMCMVGLVLLIACANVANLLIARALSRQKEIAVRLSIGASRARLVRQLLVESLVLSMVGGVAGIALAMAMTKGPLALIPSESGALLIQPTPDLRILFFTLGLTFLTSLVFGLVPALRASRPDLWVTLKDAAGSIAGAGGSIFFRKGLVAIQVALSFLLLFGAGLFVRSLSNLLGTQTGFKDAGKLVSFALSPSLNGYSGERTGYFYQQLVERLRSAPGVRSAGYASVAVLAGDEWDSSVKVEGHTARDGEDMQAFMNAVSPGYFDTMGVSLLAGRHFDRRDLKRDANVAIVNESFARHYFGKGQAVGKHLGQGGPTAKIKIEIVGVVADSLYEGPREGVRRQVFLPKEGNGSAVFYLRVNGSPDAAYAAIKSEVRKLDSAMPVFDLKTLQTQLNETLLSERLVALMSAGFGLLATLLATIGLYGVMAFVVARRTKEVGVRMALGAPRGAVIWMVMREVVLLVTIGLAIGVPAAVGLGRYVATQLYGVKPSDPWTAAVTMVLLVTAATLAGLIPARRASRIDPILALRYE
jgi:predicted permease